jgi:nitroreductase
MPDVFPRQFDHVLRTRRTVGRFRCELPPRELILTALESAVWAPNHHKTEPWRFTLLGPAAVEAVIDLNTDCVAANKGDEEAAKKRKQWSAVPGWLVVTCVVSPDPIQHEEDYAACCCAIQNLMLSLWSRGVGTKWSTGSVTRHPRFAEIAWFDPAAERVVGLVWYGYPEVVPEQTRMPVAEVLREVP